MNQLTLFTSHPRASTPRRAPYAPFDAVTARSCILKKLHQAGGEWVRRMALSKATGMHPRDVSRVLAELARTGLIEETEAMDIIHPRFGVMGRTRGYRIIQRSEVSA